MKYFTPHFRITIAILLTLLCAVMWSGNVYAQGSVARASFTLTINVAPTFRMLSQEPQPDGMVKVTAYSNMRSVILNGKQYALGRPGNHTLLVPAVEGQVVVLMTPL